MDEHECRQRSSQETKVPAFPLSSHSECATGIKGTARRGVWEEAVNVREAGVGGGMDGTHLTAGQALC